MNQVRENTFTIKDQLAELDVCMFLLKLYSYWDVLGNMKYRNPGMSEWKW